MRRTARGLVGAGLIAMVLAASIASAQRIMVAPGRVATAPAKLATPEDFDGSFIYCRGAYQSVVREAGGTGWSTDYPAADNNFSVRLMELTLTHVRLDVEHQPNTVVVRLSDPLLYRCPILFMEDVGTARFTAREVETLHDYFVKGGFLWVDDFWGSYAWSNWAREISRVLPPSEYPIFDIPITHPIMHTLYDVKEVLQVCSIQFWNPAYPNETSERGADSAQVHFRGIQDSHGRLIVVMTHNTDIADTWEREGENRQYFDLFSPRGYAIGVNVVLYAMTH
jgi:hypothetical protein